MEKATQPEHGGKTVEDRTKTAIKKGILSSIRKGGAKEGELIIEIKWLDKKIPLFNFEKKIILILNVRPKYWKMSGKKRVEGICAVLRHSVDELNWN